MTAIGMTSELEAINVLLAVADEAPVQSLVVPGLLPLTQARAVLDETSRAVQSVGWKFNTEYDYPLTRQVDGTISLPANALKVDVEDTYLGQIDPVARGLRLYDAQRHSYSFERDLKATMVFLLPWEEMPQPVRHYVMIKAARTFQARQMGSDAVDRFTEVDEINALVACSSYEADVGDHNMLRDSLSCSSILFGREW